MKGLKRAVAIALAVTMTASLVVGCSKKQTSPTESNSGSQKTSTEKHTFTAMVTESPNLYCKFADRDKYITWKELNKIFESKGLEIKFDIVQSDQYATTVATSLASASDLAEYISCYMLADSTMVSCIKNGTFLPINDLVEAGDGTSKSFLEKHNFAVKKASYTDGKLYWMPAMQETYYNGKLASTCTNVLIRYDWLTKLGIGMPKTLDEFTAYLQAAQDKDLNSNGIKDEYYVAGLKDFGSGIPQWFGLPNNRFGLTSDGKAVSTWEMEGVKDYFRYMKMLLDKGLISKDYIACEDAVTDAANANNQASSLSSYCLQGWLEPEVQVQEGAAPANYVSVMPIQGKAGVNPISNIEPTQLADWRHCAFTKNLKDRKAASIFLDVIYSDKFEELTAWGVKGVTYEEKDGIRVLVGDATTSDWQAASISGNCVGDAIWGYAFPMLRFSNMENEIMQVSKEKGEAQREVITYPYTMIDDMKAYLATASEEEAATLEKYEANYQALSEEIGIKLYKGEINPDTDWETKVIKPLKAAGMDALMAVYQARADRFFK